MKLLNSGTLRKNRITLILITLAMAAHAFLYYHLTTNQYTHFDIALFFSGLILLGIALWRFDTAKTSLRIPRSDILILIVLCAGTLALNTVHLLDWKFVVIGDEGAFLDRASYIYGHGNAWNFFQLQGVYGIHPDLDSAYQALFLRIFGRTVFSWRLSTVIVQVLSVALIYLLALLLWGRLAAITSAIVIGSSHYLMAFNHIAYNNTHCIFYALLAMVFLVLTLRTQKIFFAYLTGVSLGFGIYTVAIALLTWPIVLVFLLIRYTLLPSRKQFLLAVIVLLGILMTAIPALLVTPDHFSKILRLETHLGHITADQQYYGDWLAVAGATFKYSAIAWWSNDWLNHYVSGALIDFITGILLIIGLFVAFLHIKKPAEQLILIWLFLGLLILSITSGSPEPSITRMLYLLPPVALLSGLALSTIYVPLQKYMNIPKIVALTIIILTLLTIPILNIHQFFFVSPKYTSPSVWDIKFKVFQKHPDSRLVEIVDKNVQDSWLKIINWYPDIKTRYTYVELSELDNFTHTHSLDKGTLFFIDKYNSNLTEPVIQLLQQYDPILEYDEHAEQHGLLLMHK